MVETRIVAVVHIDDDSGEQRQVSEQIANKGLEYYFKKPIKDGRFKALNGGFGNVEISWSYGSVFYRIDYIKYNDAESILNLKVEGYSEIVFIFDVHKDKEYGTGQLFIDSYRNAEAVLGARELKGIIWTNFPNAMAAIEAGVEIRLKINVDEFAVEVMSMLGFTVHE